jgi:hypothetical protein
MVAHHLVSIICILIATNMPYGGQAFMAGGIIVELGSVASNLNDMFASRFTNVLYAFVMPITNLVGLYVVYNMEMTPFLMQCLVKIASVVLLMTRTFVWITDPRISKLLNAG